MHEWIPIKDAPRDGRKVLCGWPDGSYDLLIWKRNDRIVRGQEGGEFGGHVTEYFGDADESDDYDLAEPRNFPTMYLPIPPLPSEEKK